MRQIYRPLQAFAADETGTTSVEYALIAIIVAVGIVSSLGTYTGVLTTTYNDVGASLTSASAN